jgi:hypothetical protein
MKKIRNAVLASCLIFGSGCATYPNTYIQDSTITTNTQGGVVGGPVGGSYYPNNPGTFLQWLVFGPPGGYYGGGWGGGGWGGYYPPAYGGGSFWYNGNGGGCW